MRSPNPRRRRPAQASTSASNPPASSLAMPRVHVAADGSERGSWQREAPVAPRAARCPCRCSRPVQTAPTRPTRRRDPRGKGGDVEARSRPADLPAAGTPPRASPSGSSTGRSFALCTARSASPRRSASSSSLTNWRLLSSPATGACCESIAGRRDDDDLGARAGRAKPVRHGLRLPQREPAAARGDSEHAGRRQRRRAPGTSGSPRSAGVSPSLLLSSGLPCHRG